MYVYVGSFSYIPGVHVINNINLNVVSMLDFISHLGGNGWTVKNSGGAEARKPKGQPNDTRHGEQEGTMLYIMSNCTDTRCLILLSLSLSHPPPSFPPSPSPSV